MTGVGVGASPAFRSSASSSSAGAAGNGGEGSSTRTKLSVERLLLKETVSRGGGLLVLVNVRCISAVGVFVRALSHPMSLPQAPEYPNRKPISVNVRLTEALTKPHT